MKNRQIIDFYYIFKQLVFIKEKYFSFYTLSFLFKKQSIGALAKNQQKITRPIQIQYVKSKFLTRYQLFLNV